MLLQMFWTERKSESYMDHIIVDDFLDNISCEKLIDDATHYCPKTLGIEMHGGRNFIPFSSVHWRQLLKVSAVWQSLHIRLQSQEFIDWVVEELAPPGCDQDLRSTTCYGKRRSWLASRTESRSGSHGLEKCSTKEVSRSPKPATTGHTLASCSASFGVSP